MTTFANIGHSSYPSTTRALERFQITIGGLTELQQQFQNQIDRKKRALEINQIWTVPSSVRGWLARSGAERAHSHLLRNKDETATYVTEDARRYVLWALRSDDFLKGLRADLCGALVNPETSRLFRDDATRPAVRSADAAKLALDLASSQRDYWLRHDWTLEKLASWAEYLIKLSATYDLLHPVVLSTLHDEEIFVGPLAEVLVSEVVPLLGPLMKDTMIESVHDLANNDDVLEFSKRSLIEYIRRHQNEKLGVKPMEPGE